MTLGLDDGWIESNGGPLLVLAQSLLGSWSGVDGPVGTSSDYDRACAAEDLASIAVGSGQALVLGDEPLATRVYDHESGILLVRWRYAPASAAVEAAIAGPLTELDWQSVGVFQATGEPLLIFDAAFPGLDPGGAASWLWLSVGTYAVEVAEYSTRSEVALQLIRLSARAA